MLRHILGKIKPFFVSDARIKLFVDFVCLYKQQKVFLPKKGEEKINHQSSLYVKSSKQICRMRKVHKVGGKLR